MKHEREDIGRYARIVVDFIKANKLDSRDKVADYHPKTTYLQKGSVEVATSWGTPIISYFLSGNGTPLQVAFGLFNNKVTLTSVHEYAGYEQGKKDKDKNITQTRKFSPKNLSDIVLELERLSQDGGAGFKL